MSELNPFPDGGYAFLKGGFPYSQGVKALQGFNRKRASCSEKCRTDLPAWALYGGKRPRYRCTRFTIFIRFCPGKLSHAPATVRGLPGITAGRQSRNSNLKWMFVGLQSNVSSKLSSTHRVENPSLAVRPRR